MRCVRMLTISMFSIRIQEGCGFRLQFVGTRGANPKGLWKTPAQSLTTHAPGVYTLADTIWGPLKTTALSNWNDKRNLL
jgi:hypothetical protein